MKISKAVGIDLGTTNSVIAIMKEDNQEIICNKENGRKTFPSVVVYDTQSQSVKCGQLAFNRRGTRPEPIVSIKRQMGNPQYRAAVGDRQMSPSEVSAVVLREMKNQMEAYLHQIDGYEEYVVDRAVITVPAYFTSDAKEATTKAGELAGLQVELTLQEPTASALYYCKHNQIDDDIFMVYDLGGGTFDVSIVRMAGGVADVIGIAGNNYLGGDNFDELLANKLLKILQDPGQGYDLNLDIYNDEEDARRFTRLKLEAEVIKKKLSENNEYYIANEGVFTDKNGAKVNLAAEITRAEFEDLIRPVLMTTLEECDKALAEAQQKKGITLDQIKGVLLVGGSTHIPLVKEIVRERFTNPDLPIHTIEPEPLTQDPDMAVGYGAAIAASSLETRKISDAITDHSGNPALVLSVSTLPGVWASAGKSTVKGQLTAVEGTLPAGCTAKVQRADGTFSAEFPVEADGSFSFSKLPAREKNDPYACSVWADGQKLLDFTFNAAVGEVGDVPVVLSRNYYIEVTRSNTGSTELFPLLLKGTPLPTSNSYAFTVLNEYMAELRFFEETRFLKKVPIIFDPPIPAGTPISLSISCNKQSIFSALAKVADKTISIEFESSPPPPPPTEEEIRNHINRFEQVKPTLNKGKEIAAQKKIERYLDDIHQGIAEKDVNKAIDRFNEMIAYVDKLQPVSVSLKPSQEAFESLVNKCERLNAESAQGSADTLAEIQSIRSSGAVCYERGDQAGLTDAQKKLSRIQKHLEENTGEPKPQPPTTPQEKLLELCQITLTIIQMVDGRTDLPEAFRKNQMSTKADDQRTVLAAMQSLMFETDEEKLSQSIITVSKIGQRWHKIQHMVFGVGAEEQQPQNGIQH